MQNYYRKWFLTGGASGIGLALTKAIWQRGDQIIICGRDERRLSKVAEQYSGVIARRCDLTDSDERASLVQWLAQQHTDLDVLVNNAGVQQRHDLLHSPAPDNLAAVEREIATNLIAPVALTIALLPLLKRRDNAAIVNVTSGLAFAPLPHLPIYCATKAAMHSFTLSLRAQLRETSVRVIEVAPPAVSSGLGAASSNERAGVEVLSPDDFVAVALPRILAGETEVLIGQAAFLRTQGETFFLHGVR